MEWLKYANSSATPSHDCAREIIVIWRNECRNIHSKAIFQTQTTAFLD